MKRKKPSKAHVNKQPSSLKQFSVLVSIIFCPFPIHYAAYSIGFESRLSLPQLPAVVGKRNLAWNLNPWICSDLNLCHNWNVLCIGFRKEKQEKVRMLETAYPHTQTRILIIGNHWRNTGNYKQAKFLCCFYVLLVPMWKAPSVWEAVLQPLVPLNAQPSTEA